MDAKEKLNAKKTGTKCEKINCEICPDYEECNVMFCQGYHSRDEEVNNLFKQTTEYEKDIIDIQTESFEKDKRIEELKELLKEANRCLCNSCRDLKEVGGCQVCHINDVKNKINEVLNNDK